MKKIGITRSNKYITKEGRLSEDSPLELGTVYKYSRDDGYYVICFFKDELNTTINYCGTGINVGNRYISEKELKLLKPNNKLSRLMFPDMVQSKCGKYLIKEII